LKQGRRCAKDTVIPEEALGVKTALGELSDMNDKIESGLNRIERGIGEEEGEFDFRILGGKFCCREAENPFSEPPAAVDAKLSLQRSPRRRHGVFKSGNPFQDVVRAREKPLSFPGKRHPAGIAEHQGAA